MFLRKTAMGLASAGLLLGSTAAVAAPAAVDARIGAPVTDAEDLNGGYSLGWVIGALIAIGVIVVIVTDDSEDDDPFSP